MGLRKYLVSQGGDCLYTSESAVYRRQILTYKKGPRTERVDHKGAMSNSPNFSDHVK